MCFSLIVMPKTEINYFFTTEDCNSILRELHRIWYLFSIPLNRTLRFRIPHPQDPQKNLQVKKFFFLQNKRVDYWTDHFYRTNTKWTLFHTDQVCIFHHVVTIQQIGQTGWQLGLFMFNKMQKLPNSALAPVKLGWVSIKIIPTANF